MFRTAAWHPSGRTKTQRGFHDPGLRDRLLIGFHQESWLDHGQHQQLLP
jgi:hypothetical protein